MKRWHKVVLIVGLSVGLLYGVHKAYKYAHSPVTPSVETNLSPVTSVGGCDATLWNHIYNPTRLQVIKSCITVTGTVEVIRHEADGDQHVLIRLDPQFSNLVNSINISKQHGDLVIEPVCNSSPSQQDTIDQGVCDGFNQDFNLTIGEHISILGAYVLDTQHGWNELHPVTSITKL